MGFSGTRPDLINTQGYFRDSLQSMLLCTSIIEIDSKSSASTEDGIRDPIVVNGSYGKGAHLPFRIGFWLK
jgi:hypothetical protein